VATTTMVADLVRQVGGMRITVDCLMAPGVDPHSYKATPRDIDRLMRADLVVASGLHLEGKLSDLLSRLEKRVPVLMVADALPHDRLLAIGPELYDPHVWFDAQLWSLCPAVVAAALEKIDPSGQEHYRSRAVAYAASLVALDAKLRDRIASIPQQQRVLVTAHDAFRYFGRAYGLEVVGVLDKQGSAFGNDLDNQIVIPITRFNQDFSRWPDLTITAKVRDLSQVDDAREELRGIMRKLRRVPPDFPDDFAINSQEAIVTFFNAVGGTIAAVGLFISGLSLFVGGIGIMNIMFVSVAERTKEIGIRKAIGAKRRTILVQFLVEAATITLGAGILGILVAWPLTLVVDKFLAASMPWWLVAVALLVSVLTGVVSGFLPAWRAARMDPVDALRAD